MSHGRQAPGAPTEQDQLPLEYSEYSTRRSFATAPAHTPFAPHRRHHVPKGDRLPDPCSYTEPLDTAQRHVRHVPQGHRSPDLLPYAEPMPAIQRDAQTLPIRPISRNTRDSADPRLLPLWDEYNIFDIRRRDTIIEHAVEETYRLYAEAGMPTEDQAALDRVFESTLRKLAVAYQSLRKERPSSSVSTSIDNLRRRYHSIDKRPLATYEPTPSLAPRLPRPPPSVATTARTHVTARAAAYQGLHAPRTSFETDEEYSRRVAAQERFRMPLPKHEEPHTT